MTAVRGAMLAMAVVLAAAAFGALPMDLQASAQRLVVTAVTCIVAPLFWPGAGHTLARTGLRVAGWSASAAFLAAALLGLLGGGRQPLAQVATACTMLMLILFLTFALAAVVDRHLRRKSNDLEMAGEMAGRLATLALALTGALPLWLGPLAEILARTRPWVVDAVVAISPLTHLAVASGNDLLRNQWLYDHSNLATLAVSYPSLHALLLSYVSIALALVALPLAEFRRSRRIVNVTPSHPASEDDPA